VSEYKKITEVKVR